MSDNNDTQQSAVPKQQIVMTPDLERAIERMKTEVDSVPWYWFSFGEKCYAFGLSMCVAKDEADDHRVPRGGSRLWYDEDSDLAGRNEAGETVKMYEYESLLTVERQEGDAICEFLAVAHTALCQSS